MKKLFPLLALLSLPALAQIGRPFPPGGPAPIPGPWNPYPDPGFCMGRAYDDAMERVRELSEAKAQAWGAEKGVECSVSRVSLYNSTVNCVSETGARFATLRLSFSTICGTWNATVRHYKTRITYYRE